MYELIKAQIRTKQTPIIYMCFIEKKLRMVNPHIVPMMYLYERESENILARAALTASQQTCFFFLSYKAHHEQPKSITYKH